MSVHVAILTAPYDRMLLDGSKRIESRFTRQAREPFDAATPGQMIYFKRSGGPFFAAARIARVLMVDRVTPEVMDELAERYGQWIGAPASYWRSKRDTTKFATLLWLEDVRPTRLGPSYRPQSMRAWYVLPDDAAPAPGEASDNGAFEVALTHGSLRQRSVRVAAVLAEFPADALGGPSSAQAGRAVTLHLDGGPSVETDIDAKRKMLRYRGWGPWFEQRGVAAGDRLVFTPTGRRAFDVTHVKGHGR